MGDPRKQQQPARGFWPWWLSVLLAALLYGGLKWLLPELIPRFPQLQAVASAGEAFAPMVAIPLLLLAAKQLYDDAGEGSDNDSQEEDREKGGRAPGEKSE